MDIPAYAADGIRKGAGMKLLTICEQDAGQRLDKYLSRYLAQAPKGFLYKMMRKKNITLNAKRCEGPEKLRAGDEILPPKNRSTTWKN